jgi:hypothetical protein
MMKLLMNFVNADPIGGQGEDALLAVVLNAGLEGTSE